MMDPGKRSLLTAKQYRLCPPGTILSDPMHKEEARRHLSICPYCSASLPEADSWDELAERIKSSTFKAKVSGPSPTPGKGSVCLIKSGKGVWRGGNFYNPPAVLILDEGGSIADDVLVAQIYHDIVLAAPGDLILEADRCAAGELFVESWNTYTLRLKDLESPICRLEEGIVQAVGALEADPDHYPDWALRAKPMAKEDPRIYFREMEVEVGYVFSSAAVSELMGLMEGSRLRLVYGSPAETMAEIRKGNEHIRWQGDPGTVEEVLAAARFPLERYAMAAATDDRETFPANLVTIRSGRVKQIAPVEGTILERRDEPDGLVIGGRITVPEGVEIQEVLCFLETSLGEFISSVILDWDPNGHFRAQFPVSFHRDMELLVAVLQEDEDA